MLRICVFKGRDDMILVCAGKAETIQLPPLAAPFTKASVTAELRAGKCEAIVIETVLGRWTRAMLDAKHAEEGARGQKQRFDEATRAQVMLGSVDAAERDRAKLVLLLQEKQSDLLEVKGKIVGAKARCRRESFAGPAAEDLARLDRREISLKQEMMAIQAQLSAMNKERKAGKEAERRAFGERFLDAVREILDEDLFQELVMSAQEKEEE